MRASEEEHPDLFWALHGGGGNFGVATSFTFRLHPSPSVTAALLLWQPEAGPTLRAPTAISSMPRRTRSAAGSSYLTGPAEDFVPEASASAGSLCAVLVAYAGTEAEARRAMAPMLGLGHEGELIVEVPYAELQCMLDDPPGYRNYWSAEYLDAFPDEAVDRFCARADDMIVPSPSQHVLFPSGGAVARGPADYPIPWRRRPGASTPSGCGKTRPTTSAASSGRATCAPTSSPGRPAPSTSTSSATRARTGSSRGFGRENYERLAAIKARVRPATTSST